MTVARGPGDCPQPTGRIGPDPGGPSGGAPAERPAAGKAGEVRRPSDRRCSRWLRKAPAVVYWPAGLLQRSNPVVARGSAGRLRCPDRGGRPGPRATACAVVRPRPARWTSGSLPRSGVSVNPSPTCGFTQTPRSATGAVPPRDPL